MFTSFETINQLHIANVVGTNAYAFSQGNKLQFGLLTADSQETESSFLLNKPLRPMLA